MPSVAALYSRDVCTQSTLFRFSYVWPQQDTARARKRVVLFKPAPHEHAANSKSNSRTQGRAGSAASAASEQGIPERERCRPPQGLTLLSAGAGGDRARQHHLPAEHRMPPVPTADE